MNRGDLAKWRFWAPFVIAGFCLLPFFLVTVDDIRDIDSRQKVIVPVVAAVIAYLYAGFDLRNGVWHYEIRTHLGPQIQDALLRMVPNDLEITESEKAILVREDVFKQLTGVFWEAVDRDPQLKEHKPHFYANGVKYTTAIDVAILTVVAGLFYALGYLTTGRGGFLAVAAGLCLLSILTTFLIIPRVRKRHRALSAEQLDFLRRNQKQFVEDRFREIVLARRREGVLR